MDVLKTAKETAEPFDLCHKVLVDLICEKMCNNFMTDYKIYTFIIKLQKNCQKFSFSKEIFETLLNWLSTLSQKRNIAGRSNFILRLSDSRGRHVRSRSRPVIQKFHFTVFQNFLKNGTDL